MVYSPAFNFGRNGADVGYGANFLAQGSWYTVNDMLLVIGEGANVQHYLYTVTDEVSSYILPNKQVRQLMEISYQSYEKGDMRYLECHANADVRGYSGEIPNGFVLSQGGSTFLAPPAEEETLCPGGCGQVISHCRCATICPDCNEHIDHCICTKSDPEGQLASAAAAAEAALAAYIPDNSVTQAHLDAFARLTIGCHHVHRSWSGFNKVNATRDNPGSVTATLTLTIGDYGFTRTVPVSVTIPALPQADGAGRTITPDATIGGEKVTMIAMDLDENFTLFDIMTLFGMSGGPYTYALWFGPDGSFSFDRDVTLTKTYYASDFSVLGTDSIPVKRFPRDPKIVQHLVGHKSTQAMPFVITQFDTVDDGNIFDRLMRNLVQHFLVLLCRNDLHHKFVLRGCIIHEVRRIDPGDIPQCLFYFGHHIV